MTIRPLMLLLVLATLAASCGGGGAGTIAAPSIGAAHQYQLGGFRPQVVARPGHPTTVAFTVIQPDGKPLVDYKTGPGPHTGVHLIIVRNDLNTIIHTHPPIGPDGRISTKVTFDEPGPYHVLVDVYPAKTVNGQVNFQLTKSLRVRGEYTPEPLPAFSQTVVTHGYTFTMHRSPVFPLAQAALATVTVKDPQGKPAVFTPWYGALAHAIFFHKDSLVYFHTHVCAPGMSGCTSVVPGASVKGSSTKPGVLHVGVLLPVPGVWRLFLQCQLGGRILTAPFTLTVK